MTKLSLFFFLSRCYGSLVRNEACSFFIICGWVVQSVFSLCVFQEHLRFVIPSCITWCSSDPEAVSLCAKKKQIRFSYSQTGLESYEGKSQFSQVPNKSGPTYQGEGCMSFKILGWDRAVLRDQHVSPCPACMKERKKCSEHKSKLKNPIVLFQTYKITGSELCWTGYVPKNMTHKCEI